MEKKLLYVNFGVQKMLPLGWLAIAKNAKIVQTHHIQMLLYNQELVKYIVKLVTPIVALAMEQHLVVGLSLLAITFT
jgi:hypothetical protein